jgi:tRNA (guanine-N7-)-methyltransferase
MSSPEPLRPHEITWEDWLLDGGAKGCFEDPSLPLEVEIGCGDDDFLYESASANPGRNWLGIEYSGKRVRRAVRRLERRGVALPNFRMIWRPAADLVTPFLSPGHVGAYHVYFPDPWPKAHHARYRLLSPDFLASLRDSLDVGGTLDIATDSDAYSLEVREALSEMDDFVPVPDARMGVGGVAGDRPTVFEERWRAAGRTIHFHRYRKDR